MYLCLCKAISENFVKEIIEKEKAKTVKDIQKFCPAGACCGSCLESLKAFMRQNSSERQDEEAELETEPPRKRCV
jgi:bacterioferritin-associated ferredoxin